MDTYKNFRSAKSFNYIPIHYNSIHLNIKYSNIKTIPKLLFYFA